MAELEDYQNGWAALSELMDSGSSWSGHERNCSLVNVGDGTFCDVSALSGFDFEDDGRAVATTDWDRDGRLDLWLRNRTGPQLRLLRNSGRGAHHFISLSLQGVTSNRDAIGARVELLVGERRIVRTLQAGSGYLSQSSKWMTIGIGAAEAVDRLSVTWPGGDRQDFAGVAIDGFYHLVQGAADLVAVDSGRVELSPARFAAGDAGSARIVLRTPLPVPPDVWGELFGNPEEPGAAWIQLWAQWCAPCLSEMDQLVERWGDLRAAGLRLVALTVDADADRGAARSVFEQRVRSKLDDPAFGYSEASPRTRAFLELLLKHVVGRSGQGELPTGFLIDRYGYLEVVVIGPVDADQLLRDVKTLGMAPEGIATRSGFPGRWFYGMPRNLPGLIAELEEAGLDGAAAFYREVMTRDAFRER